MSKKLIALCLILALVLALNPLAHAENTDTLADWDIRVTVPDGKTAVLKGGEYYIYAQDEGAIPYVMLRAYRYDSAESFLQDFTDYMRGQYDDLRVAQEPAAVTIGDKSGLELVYSYKVSGYDVKDRRVAIKNGERVYMFASKEVASLGKTVGTMLDDVVAGCVFLSAPAAEKPQEKKQTVRSAGYLYCLPDGMPKYFVDFSGIASDNVLLHCWFRSSDPTFYERVYTLHLDEAVQTEAGARFPKITDEYGFDHSERYRELLLAFDGDELVMQVDRDEKTLAGGPEDNLLTGEYRMEPVDVGFVYQYRTENKLKYWLDLEQKDIELHALFVSGDPEPYETVFTLERASAVEEDDTTLHITRVTDAHGLDVSAWFRTLRLSATEDGIVMEVERDESTLAGGAGDNILTGSYLFRPKTFFRPLSDGPYTAEELARLAQIHYFITTGFYPPEADAEENPNGSFTVHLYENVKLEDFFHTATSAWYAVGANGVGVDLITGESVNLIPSGADRMN